MIANRVLELDDYLEMARRQRRLIIVLTLFALVAGFLISFAFTPKYTSNALVLVERQTVPAGYVKPIVTAAVRERIMMLQQQVLSRNRLQPMVERLGLVKKGRSVDDVIDDIQRNAAVKDADPSASRADSSGSSSSVKRLGDTPGFYVSFTSDNPHDAQQICTELTSMLLAENLKSREQVALSTTDFLSRQLEEAKRNLDEEDQKLAAFKSHYLGQLPSDIENNLKILGGLNSQLDANTQTINRAQQDKSYAESVLAQQLSAWKSSQTSLTSETIAQRLAALQTQLVTLQARYTDDHPEVIKMKSDIAGLQTKQKEMSAPSDQNADNTETKGEPPEIRQLRQEIHHNEGVISRATQEQNHLQQMIELYQSRVTLSPKVEEDYKQLTRDNDTAHKIYESLLVDKRESEMQTDLEHRQQGEQMRLLDAANLPDEPSFPVRWKFALGGLGVGLALGLSIATWLELRDKAIRNEGDVIAALELPMLTSVPWLGPEETEEPSGFRYRLKALLGH